MIFEPTRRRISFTEGVRVILADGQDWTLPFEFSPAEPGTGGPRRGAGLAESPEPELRQLLREAWDAESEYEARHCDIALAIHLLRKNYDLGPDELQGLLGFSADSASGQALRVQLRSLVAEAARRRSGSLQVRPEAPHRSGLRPSLQHWIGRLRQRYHGHPA